MKRNILKIRFDVYLNQTRPPECHSLKSAERRYHVARFKRLNTRLERAQLTRRHRVDADMVAAAAAAAVGNIDP